MKFLERSLYLERLKCVRGVPDIKIITGIRRAGKSRLMESCIIYIRTVDPDANIVYVDFTDLKFEEISVAF